MPMGPSESRGLRPQRSTSRMERTVKAAFTTPTPTVAPMAAVADWKPAIWKMVGA